MNWPPTWPALQTGALTAVPLMTAPKPKRQLGAVPEVMPLKDVNPPVIVTGEAAARDGLASTAPEPSWQVTAL